MLGIYSSGIWRIPYLDSLLPGGRVKLTLGQSVPANVTAIAVWGLRSGTQKPVALAAAAGIPVIRLEDGFIRSQGLGVEGEHPLSIVVDRLGIYYDASVPSELEMLIADSEGNQPCRKSARELMDAIVDCDLSKYNQAPPFTPSAVMMPFVLVIDQTVGDVSVSKGNANAETFRQMLHSACEENPSAEIWVKVHPDVLSGKKYGYFPGLKSHGRVRLIAENVSPQSLLRHASHVYVVTSQYGFEALMAGKPVTCFGQPWYAGWGLTRDRHPLADVLRTRRGNATLTDLFVAAFLRYSRYRHPVNGGPCTLVEVMEWLSLQRRHSLARTGTLWVPGLSLWKRTMLKPFLQTRGNQVCFSSKKPGAGALIVWGIRGELRWRGLAEQEKRPVWRMEDGFIRSSGLGSDLVTPLSLVMDKTGIYYDATRESDLENLLNASRLSTYQRQRASLLQQTLVAHNVSKYNLGHDWRLPPQAQGKRVLLIPGQVEDDESIIAGTFSVRTNLALLRTVRERNPQAFIVFKPHPDVLSGNRQGEVSEDEVALWADCEVRDADIIACIRQADELHTMTSLSGFEALLHRKKVFCYGLPFYAGWGLTNDEHQTVRRRRQLDMADLVWQALITYPTYIHPQRQEPMSAEEAVQWLCKAPRGGRKITQKFTCCLTRQYRRLRMFCETLIG
ncbi:capsular polysaccharide biosynthesis protein [Yokenella regensburgei]|uniref:capsular polysaccharide biosynthesis protein n=1 Tax=Yokenella regensburgei TaxID=158877 RepID=UPI0027D98D2C|nr:capsular polysaccharide biosynthesis protein [Yokenella regensburgei]MDQ4429038.1 capsular polysaccharide biosynthesis protein [Yokenella regensburgei]